MQTLCELKKRFRYFATCNTTIATTFKDESPQR
jgi:hypothetical protein